MTVSTTDSVESYVSGGPAFPIPFQFFQNSDIVAVLTRQDGTSETLTTAQYTLTGSGSQNGGTLTSAYAAGVLATPGGLLTISREMVAVQPTDLRNQGKFLAETHERVFDRLTMLIQQAFSGLSRALKRPIGRANFDAEGRRIVDLANPVDPQDAATMLSVDQRIAELLATGQGPVNNAANVLYASPDGPIVTVQSMSGSGGAGLIGWILNATGAVFTTIGRLLDRRPTVDVYDFMTAAQIADVKGASVLDHTSALTAAINHCFTRLPCVLDLGNGVFNYTQLPNLARSNFTLRGRGMKATVLRCTGSGTLGSAIKIDAFASGSPTDPFVQDCNLEYLTVQGNSSITRIIDAQGIARYHWKDVNVREANSATGYGFHLKGCMLGMLDRLICSTDFQAMTNKPQTGLYMDEGRRAGVSVGNSSNNTIRNKYFEGLPIGINWFRSDQTLLLGGSPESNTTYGLLVNTGSRYNTVIGTGFESPASTADIADAGISTEYLNIYSAKAIILMGRGTRVRGGFFERIDIQSDAKKVSIRDVTYNHWNTGQGGFFNAGFATNYSGLYNAQTGQFVYPKANRQLFTIPATGVGWKNETGKYITVIVQGTGVTQIRLGDEGGDRWVVYSSTDGGGSKANLLRPGDSIEVSYSGSPTISYVVHHSIDG